MEEERGFPESQLKLGSRLLGFYVERGLVSERTGPVMSTADFLEEEVL